MRKALLAALLASSLLLFGCVCGDLTGAFNSTGIKPPVSTPPANLTPASSCVSEGFIVSGGRVCCQGLSPSTPAAGGLARCCAAGEEASSTGCVPAGSAPPPPPPATQACTNTCPGGASPSAYPACSCPQTASCGQAESVCISDSDCCSSLHCSASSFASACCPFGECATASGCVASGAIVQNDSANSRYFVCESGQVVAQAFACSNENQSCDAQACCGSLSCQSYLVPGAQGYGDYTLKKCCAPGDCLGPVQGGFYNCIANGATSLNSICGNGNLTHIPLRVTSTVFSSTTVGCELVFYIYFNLELDQPTARDKTNYAVDGDLNVTDTGSVGKNGVFLKIAGDWVSNTNYTLSINRVRDSTLVEIPANTQAKLETPLFKSC